MGALPPNPRLVSLHRLLKVKWNTCWQWNVTRWLDFDSARVCAGELGSLMGSKPANRLGSRHGPFETPTWAILGDQEMFG